MSERSIHIEIITAGGVKYAGEGDYVSLPLAGGAAGILLGHAPLLAAAEDGVVRVALEGKSELVCVGIGVAEVLNDKIIILTRAAERAEDIDPERAAEAKKRAEARLSEKSADIDKTRAAAALKRAEARLKAHAEYTKK